MSLKVQCGQCAKRFTAPDELSGKRVKCPQCGGMIAVATEEPAVAAKPPAPAGSLLELLEADAAAAPSTVRPAAGGARKELPGRSVGVKQSIPIARPMKPRRQPLWSRFGAGNRSLQLGALGSAMATGFVIVAVRLFLAYLFYSPDRGTLSGPSSSPTVASGNDTTGDKLVRLVNDLIDAIDELSNALAAVRDVDSARQAAPKLREIAKHFDQALHKVEEAESWLVTEEEAQKLEGRYKRDLEPRLVASARRGGEELSRVAGIQGVWFEIYPCLPWELAKGLPASPPAKGFSSMPLAGFGSRMAPPHPHIPDPPRTHARIEPPRSNLPELPRGPILPDASRNPFANRGPQTPFPRPGFNPGGAGAFPQVPQPAAIPNNPPPKPAGPTNIENPGKLADALRADLLAGPDDQLVEQVQWCAALERPATSLFWAVGAEIVAPETGPANLLPERGKAAAFPPPSFGTSQATLAADLIKLTGDVGRMLSEELQSRVDQGDFGQWGQPQPAASPQPAPGGQQASREQAVPQIRGVMLLESGSQKKLLASAQGRQLDVLLSFSLEKKRAENGKPLTVMIIRLHNVSTGGLLWKSDPLTSKQMLARKLKNAVDPAAKLVDSVTAFIDKDVRLQALPPLSSGQARQRANLLAGEESIAPLARLIELRYYQLAKLLSDQEAEESYAAILGADEAKLLATGRPAERRQSIEKLLAK